MNGKIIYFGTQFDSINFFNKLGGIFKVPENSNPCDHFMFVMSKNITDQEEFTEIFLSQYEEDILPTVENEISKICENVKDNQMVVKNYAPACNQWMSLLKRARLVTVRSPAQTFIRLGQTRKQFFFIKTKKFLTLLLY